MKNVLRVLFLGSLMLSITACELFSPKEWAKYERGKAKRGYTCDYHRDDRVYECYNKRPFCKRDSTGEITECTVD